ncbi:peptidyl-prolyl cis-trans isomerase G-like isoform X2 [Oncorhynchus nerka]|uniref:peptidyl-prolyl cis-trans isomerase G-like isoform X2 n=1 Tax=Oncorhynchus nerka TaxID=8023 RepID=UPI0031B82490
MLHTPSCWWQYWNLNHNKVGKKSSEAVNLKSHPSSDTLEDNMPNGTRELQSGASSAMSYIMDPSARDWSKGSLRGSSGPFSPDTDGDVDGDPVQPSVDLELARKKKELEVIEEKIARKKAVLATRQLKHGAKDMPKKQTASTTVKGIAKQTKINNTIFKTYNQVTDKSSRVCLPLKRRVLDILRKFRRTPTKKQNKMRALELMISAPLENEEAHPLRLRVKVLMNQRRSPNNEVVPDDKQHNPTIQRPVHSLRTQEKDIAATGFQRFLNVLNEGVDLNKLSKIVNEENELLIVGEELPQVWPTLLEGHVDYSSRSKSSPFEEKKVRLEDEQRYEQMQTLLEIVGLDLGVEELGRLTDRTNDRLYGKMGDLKRKENEKGEEKKESEPSFKHLSTSSLPSDSASPLLNQHSNMTVEYSSSSNRVCDIERDRSERDRSERDRSERDRSERDRHRHSGTRDKDRDREEDIVREMEISERDGHREDRAREGDSPTRERSRQRCSSTRDKDRVRERDRSERNRKGDWHRHSSTRERDNDIPVVRETNRSERNRDKDGGRDPEKDWDGGQERDRDRSRRDGGRYRSERDGDRDPEKGRDGGRERDRDKYRSERDRNRAIDKDIERWLQRTKDGDKRSRTSDWDSESDWNSHCSTRDWDRERSERDRYGDESRESSIELYSYSMDPVFPVSHPHASMMANYSPTQYSQYMTYHSSPYTMAFPPGWGYPPGTMPPGTMPPGTMPPGIMPPGIMPPGNMPPGTMLPGVMLPVTMPPGIMPAGAMLPINKPRLPNPPGYPPNTNFPPYYSNGTTALNQTYTKPASNLQLSSTQPASNLQLSSTQPASNLQLSSTKPASNLQLSSTQPASNLQLSSTQPASNLQLTSTQPAGTAAVLPLLRNPPICHKKLAPWYNENNKALRRVSRQMERKWRSTNLEVFRLAWEDSKAQYRKALNAARLAYFSKQIEENKNNPKCIFDTVDKLTKKQHSPSEDGLHFT